MATFTTPEPVALRVRFDAGAITVTASDRSDTVVEVRPGRPGNSSDVEHAAATLVEQHGDEIVVSAPDVKRFFGRSPSLDITVALPTSSAVNVHVAAADVTLSGRYGGADVTSASGDVSIDRAADASISVASGDVTCEAADVNLTVKSASGDVRFGDVGARAIVTTASGDISGHDIGGDAELRTASGDVSVNRVGGSITCRTASGDVRIAALHTGSAELDSATGDLRVGVAEGTAAWLDVRSITGDVRSSLDSAGPPADGDQTVSIHARSLSGDVTIGRASA